MIMRSIDDMEGIKMGGGGVGHVINNLRYADDTVIIAASYSLGSLGCSRSLK